MDQRWAASRHMTVSGLLGIGTSSAPVLRPAMELLWSEADELAKRFVVITLFFVLGASVVAALAPLLLKSAIDRLETTGSHTAYVAALFLIAAYALSHWLSRSLGNFRDMFCGRADQRVRRQLSRKLFQHVMSLPLRSHFDRKTGAISQTLTNGLIGYRMVLLHLMLTVLPIAVELGTMAAILLLLDHTAFLGIICLSVLLYTLAFWIGVTRIGTPARAASSASVDANAVLTDSILNYETVKCFGAEAQLYRRFDDALIKTEDQWKQLYRCKMDNGLIVAVIFALSLGLSAYVAARGVQKGTMSIGEFVLVNAYVLQINQPLEMIGFAFRDIAQSMAFIEKMCDLLGQRREVDIIDRRSSLPTGPPDLVFERVSYSYHADRCVLKDVGFVVPSGKTVAVVGVSGSGKSSLVRLLVRLVEPNEGRIYLNGVPLSKIPLSALRNAVAVVPQDIALFNDSIAYNIGFGKQDSTEAEIVTAAKVAHIHDFIIGLPDGYQTQVGERGLKLSGGEKQRVAIARAAIKKPSIFVFDEATSSLDSKTERAILHDLKRITNKTTTLIIAHRLSTVVHAAQIVVLEQGSVIERGTHAELLRRGSAYSVMWRAQHLKEGILQDHASIA
jgi:ATP-binding cassette subfamily B protein